MSIGCFCREGLHDPDCSRNPANQITPGAMTVDLKAICERSARQPKTWISPAADAAVEDRAQLLTLVDRMRPYLRHTTGPHLADRCSADISSRGACTCGLDALLRELDGQRGGGECL